MSENKCDYQFQNIDHHDLDFTQLLYGVYVHISIRYKVIVISHVPKGSVHRQQK